MKAAKHMARQGDILLIRDDNKYYNKVNAVAPKRGRHILAHGEVTGHSHGFVDDKVTVFRNGGELDFEAPRVVRITHDEHGTIPLARGKWHVRRQREYREANVRPSQVVD